MYCDVEPKRKALEQANTDLAAAQEKLTKIKAKIKVSIEDVRTCILVLNVLLFSNWMTI